MTDSAIYEAMVSHRRLTPGHQVRHRLRLAYLDLDEVPEVIRRRRGWSTGPAPVRFRRADYLDGTDRPLREALDDLVLERSGRRLRGPVRMLTQLRTMGWLFNPLTTYYAFGPDGATLDLVVLEITNTPWHDRSWYVLDAAMVAGDGVPFAKDFHVSPFLPMDLTYRCRVQPPGEHLALRFDLTARGADGREERVFEANVTGRRVPLDEPAGVGAALRSAAQTAGVSLAIYAHAARLWRRGATFHRHPTRAAVSRRAVVHLPIHPRNTR